MPLMWSNSSFCNKEPTINQTIEFKWLMSFTKDKSFERTRVRFLGGTFVYQAILISRDYPCPFLLGTIGLTQKNKIKKKKKRNQELNLDRKKKTRSLTENR